MPRCINSKRMRQYSHPPQIAHHLYQIENFRQIYRVNVSLLFGTIEKLATAIGWRVRVFTTAVPIFFLRGLCYSSDRKLIRCDWIFTCSVNYISLRGFRCDNYLRTLTSATFNPWVKRPNVENGRPHQIVFQLLGIDFSEAWANHQRN